MRSIHVSLPVMALVARGSTILGVHGFGSSSSISRASRSVVSRGRGMKRGRAAIGSNSIAAATARPEAIGRACFSGSSVSSLGQWQGNRQQQLRSLGSMVDSAGEDSEEEGEAIVEEAKSPAQEQALGTDAASEDADPAAASAPPKGPKLSGKEKSALRGLASRMKGEGTLSTIPMKELTPAFASEIMLQLEAHELVNIRMHKAKKKAEVKVLGEALAKQSGATVAQVVGHTCLLYRPQKPRGWAQTQVRSIDLKQLVEAKAERAAKRSERKDNNNRRRLNGEGGW